jgi:hypothetical protein
MLAATVVALVALIVAARSEASRYVAYCDAREATYGVALRPS